MMEWWNSLNTLTQVFFSFATFFGLLFAWQLVASILGMGGHSDVNIGHDVNDLPADHPGDIHTQAEQAAVHEMITFKLLSLRSVLAFFTLFSWYTSLSLMNDPANVFWSIFFGLIWGFVGMFIVALIFYLFLRLNETGTSRLDTCVGSQGTVYLDIPANGAGEVRCTVSGAITVVKARAVSGVAIKAGTAVKVLKMIDPTTVEVQPMQE